MRWQTTQCETRIFFDEHKADNLMMLNVFRSMEMNNFPQNTADPSSQHID